MLARTAYKMKPPPSVRLKPGHPLSDKLIACYLMQAGSGVKAFDSARNHAGTLTGGATRTDSGKFGRAVDVDGTDGHIVIADHPDFTPALTPFSISALVYMHDATAFGIASKGVFETRGEWEFFLSSSDKLTIHFIDTRSPGSYIGRRYNTALTAYENKWTRLTATYDGGITSAGCKLYLNTLRIDDTDDEHIAGAFAGVRDLAESPHIGRYDSSYAEGLFDNVMFWRRVLTVSDVAKLCVRPFCMLEGR